MTVSYIFYESGIKTFLLWFINNCLRLRLGVHKGIEWNEIEWSQGNEMYLSKGKELNGMKLNNIDWIF